MYSSDQAGQAAGPPADTSDRKPAGQAERIETPAEQDNILTKLLRDGQRRNGALR